MIPIARLTPSVAEEQAVLSALRDGQWADGPVVRTFEQHFARYLGSRCAVACSSGTAALQAISAVLLQPGDEVITTPFTFIATANAVRSAGAIPRFADVDPATGNLHPDSVRAALVRCPKARAVLVVHLYGHPADLQGLTAITREHGLHLIEDCAQATGATYHGIPVGRFGRAAAFSFYATKNLATGEGGMVVTDDSELARAVRRYINHGRAEGDAYRHISLGYNLRMHGLAAALGQARLGRLDEMNERRRALASAYRQALTTLPWLDLPPELPGCHHVYHQFTARTRFRDALMTHLARRGVESRVFYPEVVYRQPTYAALGPHPECPTAEMLARTVLSLPLYPDLSSAEAATVAEAVADFRPGGG